MLEKTANLSCSSPQVQKSTTDNTFLCYMMTEAIMGVTSFGHGSPSAGPANGASYVTDYSAVHPTMQLLQTQKFWLEDIPVELEKQN